MSARPILFSGAMVRALLAGTKTQTRRIVKPQPEHALLGCYYSRTGWARGTEDGACTCNPVPAPYGVPGDLLIVRETWACHWATNDQRPRDIDPRAWSVRYAADGHIRPAAMDGSLALAGQFPKTRVSIHMPRWASRLTLEITEVRVERLQDISEADALAEGIQKWPDGRFAEDAHDPDPNRLAATSAVGGYEVLWSDINGPESWAANPWVWAVSFKVHHQNVDALINDLSAA